MSSQHRETGLIREWLDQTYEAERDPGRFLDHVIEAVPTTPQRRPRWWHRLRAMRTEALSASDTVDYRSSPIPATNGHTPTVIGRTTSMLSPVKAITAGAIAFALGGAFLMAQPFNQQSATPGASTDGASVSEDWSYFTWTLDDEAAAYSYGSFGSGRGSGLVLEASDPRASGVLDLQYNAADGGAEDQPLAMWEFQLQLANDAGAWSGTGSSVVTLEDGSDDAETSIEPWRLQGSGAYEGLTLVMVTTNRDSDEERWGFIVPTADVPTMPDPVIAE